MKFKATHPYRKEILTIEAESLYAAKLKAVELIKSQGYGHMKVSNPRLGIYLAEKPINTGSL